MIIIIIIILISTVIYLSTISSVYDPIMIIIHFSSIDDWNPLHWQNFIYTSSSSYAIIVWHLHTTP